MQYYSHIKLTQNTDRRLSGLKTKGYVHSIFDHTFNILLGNERLYTIADTTLKNGPNCLIVNNLLITDLNLNVDDTVTVEDGKLIIKDKLTIDYQEADISSFKKLIFPSDREFLSLKLKKIQEAEWYLYQLSKENESTLINEIDKRLSVNTQELKEAINLNDQREVLAIMRRFIGVGMGLTPSGDDFLTGLAYVTSLKGYPRPSIRQTLLSLKSTFKTNTNIISYSQFEMALQSEVRWEVYQTLFNIINEEEFETVESLIKGILMIGSSSGFDMLQGILFGLHIL